MSSLISAEELENLGINPGLRPENLSLDDYVKICQTSTLSYCFNIELNSMDQTSAAGCGILISVKTRYLDKQSDLLTNNHAFSYTINIQNNRSDTVQLLHRHWVITDQNNKIEEVQGKGVVVSATIY